MASAARRGSGARRARCTEQGESPKETDFRSRLLEPTPMEDAISRAAALLARLEAAGATARLGRDGTIVLRGASRLSPELKEEVARERDAIVEALLARERWARATTDRERR